MHPEEHLPQKDCKKIAYTLQYACTEQLRMCATKQHQLA